MTRSHEDLLKDEERSLKEHSRKYRLYFIVQLLVLSIGAVSGAINAFAQSDAALGTPYASPDPAL